MLGCIENWRIVHDIVKDLMRQKKKQVNGQNKGHINTTPHFFFVYRPKCIWSLVALDDIMTGLHIIPGFKYKFQANYI